MDWQSSASIEILRQRSAITWRLRQFFHEEGFCEVHTPVLGNDCVVDVHIDPITVPSAHVLSAHPMTTTLFLQTSPEFCMKRLLASGMSAIYQIGPAFRRDERGDQHNPEFTMVEWYRAGDGLLEGVDLLSRLIGSFLPELGTVTMTYQQAFQQFASLDPLAASDQELRQAVVDRMPGMDPTSLDRDESLNALFADLVQPRLGTDGPVILTHYPASQAALARISPDDPRVAERFELFYQGVELANGYHELTDAEELSRRMAEANRLRKLYGKPALPSTNRLLDAMRAGLPPSSGCALGLDRLTMVLTGAGTIDSVLPFPIERA
ncbi:MAG: EF-P lysine aminoacylase GenX [Planctomycetota bacterium]|nr:MAG: EF-P lysine aminoacylase GenX [Planctomycetota bacterium]